MRAPSRVASAALALSVVLTALIVAFVRPSAGQQADPLTPDQAVLVPEKSLALSAGPQPEYLWPASAAARPFSHILVRREASVPQGAALALFVRASADGESWTRWEEVVPNDDLYVPADGPDVLWSQVIDVGAIASYHQVRAVFTPGPDGAEPELRRVEVNTVDALQGPSDPLAEASVASEKAAGKPAVISRTAWGSPDGQGSRKAPDYANTTHIVVHHTAEANPLVPGDVNWPARVRAIWSYHAITRGWGDIGYNYLIDPFGRIYEGRAGGDNAVAFHDTGNAGSMGVAMLGTFQSVQPAPATLDSLVRLMAWKADQQGINPLGSSYYRGCELSSLCRPFNAGSVVPNIAGHRQVTPGHTTCPGDATMERARAPADRRRRPRPGGRRQPGDRRGRGQLRAQPGHLV
jgi:N-acetylmuramoyl-L-alanine amidase